MAQGRAWKAFAIAVVCVSLAIFSVFVYMGWTASSSIERIGVLTDYIYGVIALVCGQLVLVVTRIVRRSRG